MESDEAFVGGRLKGMGQGNYRDNKTIILGMKERGGCYVARVSLIPPAKQSGPSSSSMSARMP